MAPKILINVGGLEGVGSVYKQSSKGLREFSDLWLEHREVSVVWDLRLVQNNKISISALAFFLSIAHRVNHFTQKPQTILINWHSKTLGFLSDVGFFQVANYYELFDWPFEMGGFTEGQTNPNSKVMSFDELDLNRPDYSCEEAISTWKRVHREHYRQEIVNKCSSLFSNKDDISKSRNSVLILSRTCSELAVNSLLWGRASAFLGLQRSRKRITISASDIGIGIYSSLKGKGSNNVECDFDEDIKGVLLSSIINPNDFGLKSAIQTVVDFGGSISIASGKGEVFWAKPMWETFLAAYESKGVESAFSSLPGVVFKANMEQRDFGYIRHWKYSIRGTRITFSLPIGESETRR